MNYACVLDIIPSSEILVKIKYCKNRIDLSTTNNAFQNYKQEAVLFKFSNKVSH